MRSPEGEPSAPRPAVASCSREAGIQVPSVLSIVGFDDIITSAYSGPPLTTVRMDSAGMMAESVKLLLDLIQGKDPVMPPISIPTLIVRHSSGPASSA
jgi:LacI family transcriptional regulator, galactose operon repressor